MSEAYKGSAAAELKYATLPITRVDNIVQGMIRECQREDDLYAVREQVREISKVVGEFLAMPGQDGSADMWHNFAVSLARYDHYELACDILDRALKLHGPNTDLLADYLKYGLCCDRRDVCRSHYETLRGIRRVKYTWRAFSFSIDYSIHMWEQSDSLEEMDELEKQMLSLAADFRKYFPYLEESYSSEAEVYQKLRMHEKVIETLEAALQKLARTPKCALQLADMMFEQCEYEKALAALERALKNANEPQQGINSGYARCLTGLSKLAKAELEETELTPAMIRDIYLEFNLAVDNEFRHAYYRNTIREKAKELQLRYEVPIPAEFKALDELVNDD